MGFEQNDWTTDVSEVPITGYTEKDSVKLSPTEENNQRVTDINNPELTTDVLKKGLNTTNTKLGYYNGTDWTSYINSKGEFKFQTFDGDYIRFSEGNNLEINTKQFQMDVNGNLYFGNANSDNEITFIGSNIGEQSASTTKTDFPKVNTGGLSSYFWNGNFDGTPRETFNKKTTDGVQCWASIIETFTDEDNSRPTNQGITGFINSSYIQNLKIMGLFHPIDTNSVLGGYREFTLDYTFSKGDLTLFDDRFYISKQDNNIGNVPVFEDREVEDTDPYWDFLPLPTYIVGTKMEGRTTIGSIETDSPAILESINTTRLGGTKVIDENGDGFQTYGGRTYILGDLFLGEFSDNGLLQSYRYIDITALTNFIDSDITVESSSDIVFKDLSLHLRPHSDGVTYDTSNRPTWTSSDGTFQQDSGGNLWFKSNGTWKLVNLT